MLCCAICISIQIKVRDSKYGPALVIQTLETAGGYLLGFRVDPGDKLNEVFKELASLFNVFSTTPIFGVYYERKKVPNISFIYSYI